MSSWDFTNIGASTGYEYKKHIEKIFDYLGFTERAIHNGSGKCFFLEPPIYRCRHSGCREEDRSAASDITAKELLDLLNALFPGTNVYEHSDQGSSVSDCWDITDCVYNIRDMTYYYVFSNTDYGEGASRGKSHKARFALEPPKKEYVSLLADLSREDRNTELTALLQELLNSLEAGNIVCKNDERDTRIINKAYDIVKRKWDPDKDTDGMDQINIGDDPNARFIKDEEYAEIRDEINRYLDREKEISFAEKHFVLSGFGYQENRIIREIRNRGGIVHDKMVRGADYLVVNMWSPGNVKYSKAVGLIEEGLPIVIISDTRIQKAFDKVPCLSGEELEKLEKNRQERILADQEEKLKAKQEEEVRRARRVEQIMEARKAKEEAKQAAKERRERERAETLQRTEQDKLARIEAKRRKETEKEESRRLLELAKKRTETELEQARANAKVLYAPGQEPEKLHNRIQTLMAKLDEAYPDHVIVNLGKDHKKWGETITELYRQLGYADNRSFLEAYGFKMNSDKGGRPTTLDPESVIRELKRRYPEGTNQKMIDLVAENKDLPIKTLQNNANELFGMSLVRYLKETGIIRREE